MSRRALALVVGVVFLLGLATSTVAPVSAVQTAEVVVQMGKDVKATFGPIPGQWGVGAAATPTPAGCGGAANSAFAAQCDRVPVRIIVPNVSDEDDFFVAFEVSWNPKEDAEGVPVNDIDLYFFDNQQIARRNGTTGFTRLALSAGTDHPEKFTLYRPELIEYNLVVVNSSGPNFDYTVKARMYIGEPFIPPFEALGSEAQRRSEKAAEDNEPKPVDYSAETGPIFAEPPSGRGGLAEIALLPDADFGEGFGDFDDQLAAPVVPQMLPPGLRAAATRAGPVPAIVLVFWFGLVPVALLGGMAYLVMRRSRAAFSF